MYRAVGENSWRDGVFSHAAPAQAYQSGARQYADGSLGATARLVGQQGAFRDGALGRRPLLPSLRGALGSVFRDGSLGVDVTTGLPVPDNVVQYVDAHQAGEQMDAALKQPWNQLTAVVLVGLTAAVAYLYWKK